MKAVAETNHNDMDGKPSSRARLYLEISPRLLCTVGWEINMTDPENLAYMTLSTSMLKDLTKNYASTLDDPNRSQRATLTVIGSA